MKGSDPTKKKLPVLFPGTTPKQTLPREERVGQFLRNNRRAKFLKTGEGVPLNIMAEGLGRAVVWVAGVQKRFGLPVLEKYPEGYEFFLRKVMHLRVLGVSEETLREFWAIERKLIEVLHLDPQCSPTWMVDACAYPSDPNRRLLLSNIDLGVDGTLLPQSRATPLGLPTAVFRAASQAAWFPQPVKAVQIGLNFAATSTELFAGKEMGEDALRLISDYRTRLAAIRSTGASESRILRAALKWEKSLGLALTPLDGKYKCSEERMHPME